MIPLHDDNPTEINPLVTIALIVTCALVFLYEVSLPERAGETFVFHYGAIPASIFGHEAALSEDAVAVPVTLTLLTSMFLHGGWMHLIGNMLYLWIFGDNIENALGHLRYLIFYLVCGVLASLAHVFTTAATHGNMLVPSLGASGAISGVLGGYMLLFPGRRVRMLMGRGTAEMPAWVSIGVWFLFQVVAGMGLLGGGSQAGGVAYAAHVGGFVAGLVLVKVFAAGLRSR